ncbi:MAG: hypothetical protein V4722_19125 [Bacteroidota bacterium]
MRYFFALLFITLFSCQSKYLQVEFPIPNAVERLSGTAFYDSVKKMNWKEREAVALPQLLAGNMPAFLLKFVPIQTSIFDTATGQTIQATYYVSQDYVSIGTDDDWARLPLTPMTAQPLADSLHCFLPTRKMVNDIYQQATVKLSPMPLYAFRDSSVIMYHHHLMIEGQRKGKTGLIAGIKKDVVISDKLTRSEKKDRVAIYGWHQLNGQPIQPLYTGHINWWVDYSHGIRLVYRIIKVNGKQMDYLEVMKDAVLRKLLSDEVYSDVFRY